ncbi:hypothetical protein Clacol_009968 [Clathrus columnatus]|uniref:Flavodoxin-like domain-containing protein n=1 Tax=Clathrus columnatus TaxID=1419009 RepID=A0AAV5AMM9_9AGAM|nr:hypothetical protein Clacol_009968 [Clathrus columnatus]
MCRQSLAYLGQFGKVSEEVSTPAAAYHETYLLDRPWPRFLSDAIVLAYIVVAAVYLRGLYSQVPVNEKDPTSYRKSRSKWHRKKRLVIYGSQTGTAEEYAIRLLKKQSHGLVWPLVPDLCVIFVMVTYGEGEPTDNAKGNTDLTVSTMSCLDWGTELYEH